MLEIIPTIKSWLKSDKEIGMATVIRVEGSSPRPVGSKMIVSNHRDLEGSVSGGCVENNVIEETLKCLKDSKPRIQKYGIDDSNPWSVGLACGGKIEVFIEALFNPNQSNGFSSSLFNQCVELISKEESFILSLILSPSHLGTRGLLYHNQWVEGNSSGLWSTLLPESSLQKLSVAPIPQIIEVRQKNKPPSEIFIEPVFPQPKLIIIGAVHIAVFLTLFGKNLGYKTIVIDPRRTFLTRERFPQANELIPKWPQDVLPSMNLTHRDCIVVLSHDEKIDLPAAAAALNSSVGYIGMLGSKRTRTQRFDALMDMGIPKTSLERVHAPIGMDIKAVKPAEIATAIMAEIIAHKREMKNERYH